MKFEDESNAVLMMCARVLFTVITLGNVWRFVFFGSASEQTRIIHMTELTCNKLMHSYENIRMIGIATILINECKQFRYISSNSMNGSVHIFSSNSRN